MPWRETPTRSGVEPGVRGLAIAWLVLTVPAGARADAIWCGTFEDGRPREIARAPRAAPATPPAPPAARVRIDGARVDGARDPRTARRIEDALAPCADAGGRGAAQDLELAVSADGTVVDARVGGEPGGARCYRDHLRSIRFPRALRLRIVSARVVPR
jgi:hypothetical protein